MPAIACSPRPAMGRRAGDHARGVLLRRGASGVAAWTGPRAVRLWCGWPTAHAGRRLAVGDRVVRHRNSPLRKCTAPVSATGRGAPPRVGARAHVCASVRRGTGTGRVMQQVMLGAACSGNGSLRGEVAGQGRRGRAVRVEDGWRQDATPVHRQAGAGIELVAPGLHERGHRHVRRYVRVGRGDVA